MSVCFASVVCAGAFYEFPPSGLGGAAARHAANPRSLLPKLLRPLYLVSPPLTLWASMCRSASTPRDGDPSPSNPHPPNQPVRPIVTHTLFITPCNAISHCLLSRLCLSATLMQLRALGRPPTSPFFRAYPFALSGSLCVACQTHRPKLTTRFRWAIPICELLSMKRWVAAEGWKQSKQAARKFHGSCAGGMAWRRCNGVAARAHSPSALVSLSSLLPLLAAGRTPASASPASPASGSTASGSHTCVCNWCH